MWRWHGVGVIHSWARVINDPLAKSTQMIRLLLETFQILWVKQTRSYGTTTSNLQTFVNCLPQEEKDDGFVDYAFGALNPIEYASHWAFSFSPDPPPKWQEWYQRRRRRQLKYYRRGSCCRREAQTLRTKEPYCGDVGIAYDSCDGHLYLNKTMKCSLVVFTFAKLLLRTLPM
jgi:hypothetical protein